MTSPVASPVEHRLRILWNAVLGILTELLLIAAIITVSLAVCVLWWGLFK